MFNNKKMIATLSLACAGAGGFWVWNNNESSVVSLSKSSDSNSTSNSLPAGKEVAVLEVQGEWEKPTQLGATDQNFVRLAESRQRLDLAKREQFERAQELSKLSRFANQKIGSSDMDWGRFASEFERQRQQFWRKDAEVAALVRDIEVQVDQLIKKVEVQK